MRGRLLNKDEIKPWFNCLFSKDFPNNKISSCEMAGELSEKGLLEVHIYQNRLNVYVGYAAVRQYAGTHVYQINYEAIGPAKKMELVREYILDDVRGNLETVDSEAVCIFNQ